ncbi:hypothetical protein EV421DRAFT_1739432 [Armillaria borealis]|uniref:Uncharacterized protein n=1 Tax=Armillaria borealis TaxID=47425 RepID=A0AA39MK77_9AGAR|nr:hypothetical protein EV421DRAFT_1739432 [Armillaria borealis]
MVRCFKHSFLLFQPHFFDLSPWNPITLHAEPVRIAQDAAPPLLSAKFMWRLQRVYAMCAGATTPCTIPSCVSASTRGPTVLLVAEDLLCFSMFHVQQENNPLYCQCGGPCDFHRVDEPVISSPADILASTIPAFSSPPPPPVPVSAPIATPVMTAPSFFHPPPAGTGFQSISAPAPLPYPLVPSSSGSSAPHTPLQTNPASMVAQMVASSSSTASSSMSGLQIPPDPLLTAGLQPPPSFPAYTGLSGPLPLIDRLTALKLSFTAVLDHQKCQDTPTIPGLNLSEDAQPHDCGTTKLMCAKSTRQSVYWNHSNLHMHCSLAKAVRPAGTEVETRLKSCFVIVPSYGNIVHQITNCFQANFKPTPIHPEKAAMPHPCFAARRITALPDTTKTQVSSSVTASTLTPADPPQEQPPLCPNPPPPYENPKWDFPGGELQRLRQDTFSPRTHVRIRAADPKQAAQVLWTVLLHIGSLVHLLPDGEKVDPQTHALPNLPAGATISNNWGNPAAFIQMTVSIDGPGIGDSITMATLSTLLQCLLDETDPDSCYGGLQGGSPLQAPQMPVHDLTAIQAAFCICPDISLFLHAWLDLEKSQPLSTHKRPDQRYLEPVPVFLNDHCDGIITFQPTLGVPLLGACVSDSLPSSSTELTPHCQAFPHFDDQEFAYWFFNNKLETLDQLKDIIWYDITGIKDTELGKRVVQGIDGTFAELVRHQFQVALEDYLSKDLIRQGTQMLQTVTASPYLPPSSRDKIQVHGSS